MWPYPKLIAHRGAGHLAPENTLAAVRLALRYNYRMVEFDVQTSLDGVPILLHDDTLDRCSNGRGLAAEKPFAELAQLDFGSWHSTRYAGEPIATLKAVAASTQAQQLYCNIEIKALPQHEEQTATLVARQASRLWSGSHYMPLLSSFSEQVLDICQAVAPHLKRALLIETAVPGDWEQRLRRLGCSALSMASKHFIPDQASELLRKGYHIGVYTVNDYSAVQHLLGHGCSMVFTDALDTIPAGLPGYYRSAS